VIAHRDLAVILLAGGLAFLQGRPAPANPAASELQTPDAPAANNPGASGVRLQWKQQAGDGTRFVVEVAGVAPLVLRALKEPEMTTVLWARVLPVRVASDGATGDNDAPPLWGTYTVQGDVIQFMPRFPLEPGTRYRATLDVVKLGAVAKQLAPRSRLNPGEPRAAGTLMAEFTPPRKPAGPAAAVVAIYPTSELLPENLLRFYIHFSAPMSRGEAYRRIRLLDAAGKPIEAAFLELDEELWSGDGTRFTLVFDPGRVKKGLKPREELGPILEAGRSYSLVIDREWPDALGRPLAGAFRKQFRAGPADDTSPDPKAWSIQPPSPGLREPLQVCFPEPLDRALLGRLIVVQDAQANNVHGQVAVSKSETLWSFTPQSPWRQGEYRLKVATELEDVAGNSVASPFEVDVNRPISRRITSDTVVVPFQVGAVAR
jgi:hypothetical protein